MFLVPWLPPRLFFDLRLGRAGLAWGCTLLGGKEEFWGETPRTPLCHRAVCIPMPSLPCPNASRKRKRGGQPGHKKHERSLIPTEDCDDVKSLKPTECRRCGKKLSGNDPEPLRHQVWELPEIKPHVTEYQRHRLGCPACGETTCTELPCGVPQGHRSCSPVQRNIILQVIRLDPVTPKIGFHFVGEIAAQRKT